ncbi:hypothetical protein JCGZ_05085 [Jatropha curcas]|uniref:Aminotransferase-like plant mobile domain-containing protein n=1 Tax=Jatropha curcas TaxID=180498 RepID=A0A067L6T4_JATCU|nr:hypothetical protein JCGZ_05085 [Jatropha curcas]
MSHLPEIPASAYTLEMETLGAISDIPTFDGDPVPVDLGKACSGGSSTDASAFWDLLDPPMRARVVAASFGDYAAGLRRTQARFPPAMRYALMERWNDCTHTFVFGFGEMTLTPADYVAVTGLRFAGPAAPLDARYQTATLGAQLVRSLLGVTTPTRYTAQGCVSYEVLLCTSQNKGDPAVLVCLRDLGQVGSFDWATLALAHLYHGLDVWTRGSGESNWQFIRPLEVWAYEYHIYPGGPSGDSPADSRRIPRYLAHCHHTYASTEDPEYWRSFLNDRALSDRRVPHAPPRHMCMLEGMIAEDREEEYEGSAVVDFLSAGDYTEYFSTRMQARLPEVLQHTQVPAQRYQELCQRFEFARSFIGRLYSERHERDLEIGRLRRHQSRQSGAMARLQTEVDQLRTRLEVEGIPLHFSEEDDGSSSDDAPPSPPTQAAAGPSRRRR